MTKNVWPKVKITQMTLPRGEFSLRPNVMGCYQT